MSSRQKSCVPCAKSKRRCEPQTPKCPRCARRGLNCFYKNVPVKDLSRTSTRQVENRISQLSSEEIASFLEYGTIVPISNNGTFSDTMRRSVTPPLFTHDIRAPGFHPNYPLQITIDRRPLETLARHIMTWPAKFVQRLETPFIHSSLQHAFSLPAPLEGAFSVCATYLSRTKDTRDIVMGIVEKKVSHLIGLDLSVLSIEAHLASLQALLMLHIIQLWDGDIRSRAQAEENSYTLESWAMTLHIRITEASKEQDAPLTWERWILLESARRTALMTLMAQGIFEMHKYGVCSYVPNMAEMPFTIVDGPWKALSQNDWKKEAENLNEATMFNYFNYANSWKSSTLPRDLSSFGKFLLVPCLACAPRETLPTTEIDILD